MPCMVGPALRATACRAAVDPSGGADVQIRSRPLRTLWFAAGTALVLAGCGDGNEGGGAPFGAEGTSNDVNAVSATFSSPAMASLGWAATGIDGVFGAPMVTGSFGAIQAAASSASLAASARRVIRSANGFNHGPAAASPLRCFPSRRWARPSSTTALPRSTRRPIALAHRPTASASSSTRSTPSPRCPSSRSPRPAMPTSSTRAPRRPTRCGCSWCRVERPTSNYGVSGSDHALPAGRWWWMGSRRTALRRSTSTCDNSYSEAANGTLGFNYHLDVPSRDLNLVYLHCVTQISDTRQPSRHRRHRVGTAWRREASGTSWRPPAYSSPPLSTVHPSPWSPWTTTHKSQHHQTGWLGAHGSRSMLRSPPSGAWCSRGSTLSRTCSTPSTTCSTSCEKTERPGALPGRFSFAAERRCYATLLQREPATSSPPGPRWSGPPPRRRSW